MVIGILRKHFVSSLRDSVTLSSFYFTLWHSWSNDFLSSSFVKIDIRDTFIDFGQIKNIHFNLDRQTGLCKGYALVEYNNRSDAQDAINTMHGKKMLGKTIHVDWAFVGSASDGIEDRFTKRFRSR
jgi:RNA-binding proteins (RRM domain)